MGNFVLQNAQQEECLPFHVFPHFVSGDNGMAFWLSNANEKRRSDMRYIGGKSLMLNNILDVIHNYTENVHIVADLFSGTGIVSQNLKLQDFTVYSNDILYFSYVLNKGYLEMNEPISKYLKELILHLNQLSLANSPWFELEAAFIYQNYSPHDDCERMFFQCENAIKIDLVRQEIERLKNQISDSEYYYLLSLLIKAVPYVSNITGTYGAYLKYWDKRTYNPLFLEETVIKSSRTKCRCFNMDAVELAKQITCDLAYLDPPYNGRQYLPNYHILETIAKYDSPTIKGITGQRVDPEKISDFCKKGKAINAFKNLIETIDSEYLLLSYNNEGILTTEEMTQLFKESGIANTFKFFEFDYRRYKNKIPNNKTGLKEQLFFIQKKQ